MNQGFIIDLPFHMTQGCHSRKELREGAATPMPSGRIPRVSRMMALAIHFDELIRDGKVADQAELAGM